MLCQLCNDITLSALHSNHGYQHKPSFHALKASAEAGFCSLCLLLWSAVKREVDQHQPEQNSFMQYPVRLCLDGTLEWFKNRLIRGELSAENLTTSSAHHIFSLESSKAPGAIQICALEPNTLMRDGLVNSLHGRVSFYREPNMDRYWDNPYRGRPVSYHANSPESFELAMRWIQSCLTEHDGCQRAVCPYEWTEELEDPWDSGSSCCGSQNSETSYQAPSKRIRLTLGGNSEPSEYRTSQRCTTNITARGLLNRPIPVTRHSRSLSPGVDDGCWKLHLRRNSLKELEESRSEMLQDLSIPLLPTRYICVDSDPPRLCLAESGSRGFYVALSHCWGNSRPLTTTTATLPDRLKGIPMTGMPRTFRDAIAIVRELGLEYLWIDSLCILQDSKQDWQKESSKMGALYSNAFLTISAAASADSTEGIFQTRSVPSNPPIEIKPRDSDDTSLYVTEFRDNVPFVTPQPIDSRAWCFQETALSPRVLIYGTEMLGWLCDSTTDSEQGCNHDHEEDPYPPLLAPRLHSKTQHGLDGKKRPEFGLFEYLKRKENDVGLWASLVNEYTRRKLSYESDRLPALSGIAKEIQLLTKDEYLAGLWKNDLRYDLLWEVEVMFSEEGDEWKRPTKYRAPSWSWASIEGPVTLSLKANQRIPDHEIYDPPAPPQLFRLLDAKVDIVGLDPFGEVSGGYLKISAGMRQVMIRERTRTKETVPSDPDLVWREKRLQERLFSVVDMQGKSIGRCCLDMPSEREWDTTTLWWLIVESFKGILVTNSQHRGQYLRVGLVWPDDSNIVPNIPEDEYEELVLV